MLPQSNIWYCSHLRQDLQTLILVGGIHSFNSPAHFCMPSFFLKSLLSHTDDVDAELNTNMNTFISGTIPIYMEAYIIRKTGCKYE